MHNFKICLCTSYANVYFLFAVDYRKRNTKNKQYLLKYYEHCTMCAKHVPCSNIQVTKMLNVVVINECLLVSNFKCNFTTGCVLCNQSANFFHEIKDYYKRFKKNYSAPPHSATTEGSMGKRSLQGSNRCRGVAVKLCVYIFITVGHYSAFDQFEI